MEDEILSGRWEEGLIIWEEWGAGESQEAATGCLGIQIRRKDKDLAGSARDGHGHGNDDYAPDE